MVIQPVESLVFDEGTYLLLGVEEGRGRSFQEASLPKIEILPHRPYWPFS